MNTEFAELAEGLNAAGRALKPGGLLAVVGGLMFVVVVWRAMRPLAGRARA